MFFRGFRYATRHTPYLFHGVRGVDARDAR